MTFSQGVHFNPLCPSVPSSFCHRGGGGGKVYPSLWRIAIWTKCHTIFTNIIHTLSPDTASLAIGYFLFVVQCDVYCNFWKRICLLASSSLCLPHFVLTFPFLINNPEKWLMSILTCAFSSSWGAKAEPHWSLRFPVPKSEPSLIKTWPIECKCTVVRGNPLYSCTRWPCNCAAGYSGSASHHRVTMTPGITLLPWCAWAFQTRDVLVKCTVQNGSTEEKREVFVFWLGLWCWPSPRLARSKTDWGPRELEATEWGIWLMGGVRASDMFCQGSGPSLSMWNWVLRQMKVMWWGRIGLHAALPASGCHCIPGIRTFQNGHVGVPESVEDAGEWCGLICADLREAQTVWIGWQLLAPLGTRTVEEEGQWGMNYTGCFWKWMWFPYPDHSGLGSPHVFSSGKCFPGF